MPNKWMFAMLLATGCATAAGQTTNTAPAAPADSRAESPREAGAQGLLRRLVLDNLPADYENTKKWGGTKRVWDGLHVSLDGLRVKTKRRWKEAKHGTWKRYRVWLIDPEDEFEINIEKMVNTPEGKTAFDVVIDARVGVWGRLSEYARDVQLLSLSADADARVRLRASCEMSLRLDATKFPPDVLLEPTVVSAKLSLIDFHLHRISDAGGPLVREFGEELHDILQAEISDREVKLVSRMNRQLKKHEDDLRLSVSELASSGLRQLQKAAK